MMQPHNNTHEIAAKRPRLENNSDYHAYNNQQQTSYIPQAHPHAYSLHLPTQNTWLTPRKMKEYMKIEKNLECIFYFFFPQAFQKSYKSEKRLMCPPPALVLSGNGWKRLLAQPFPLNEIAAMIKICDTKETGREIMEKVTTVNNPNILTLFRARSLYINSTENKKLCRLSVDLHFSNGQVIEKIRSGRIKVLSKPSKKSTKDSGSDGLLTTFKNGSQIALYNRFRQANSTRYLHCASEQFFGSLTQWSVFKIYLVDENATDDETFFVATEETICYRNKIRLVDVATEMSLPVMRIRKIAKESKEDVYKPTDKDDEPVSQLHMVSFEYVQANGNFGYLSVCTNETIFWQTLSDLNSGINEGSRWTITSADRYVYRFYPVNGLRKISMLAFPVVFDIKEAIYEKKSKTEWLEIQGNGFSENSKVWFNTCPSPQTTYKSSKILTCVIPSTGEYCASCKTLDIVVTRNDTIPIYLTNEDGNIYPTSFIFYYNKNVQGNLGYVKFVHEEDRNTIIQPVTVTIPPLQKLS